MQIIGGKSEQEKRQGSAVVEVLESLGFEVNRKIKQ